MTNNKNITYLTIAGIVAVLLGLYLFGMDRTSLQPAVIEQQTADGRAPERPAMETQAAAQPQVPEPAAVETSEEKPILGQFMRVHEIHDEDGRLRNLKFVFREGILPQTLFPDNRQLIVKYDQLARNIVGFGAATSYFYYEIVTHDSNGDGVFSESDAVTVAVSRPTGWEYRVLERNVDEVLAYEDLAEEEELRLTMRLGGEEVTRVYPLSTKQ